MGNNKMKWRWKITITILLFTCNTAFSFSNLSDPRKANGGWKSLGGCNFKQKVNENWPRLKKSVKKSKKKAKTYHSTMYFFKLFTSTPVIYSIHSDLSALLNSPKITQWPTAPQRWAKTLFLTFTVDLPSKVTPFLVAFQMEGLRGGAWVVLVHS